MRKSQDTSFASQTVAENSSPDLTRRRMLGCMAWTGTGLLWTLAGGVPRSLGLIGEARADQLPAGAFTFVQISDTHIGFNKEANPDVAGTLRRAIGEVNRLDPRPAFAIHTGDVSHLSKPDEFGQARELLQEMKVDRIHFVPGEHDALDDGLTGFLKAFGQESAQTGWYSFDQNGVHFVGLVNVTDFQPKAMTKLGAEQLAWLEKDLAGQSASTPIVVFAHIPLWTVYEPWGWGTADAPQALASLKRFGSVTVLNGHIHQVIQKVEGNVTFHTAMSTAYPQPKPGEAPAPGPLKVDAAELGKLLGTRSINVVPGTKTLATIDTPLDGTV
ncbi:metallophosphoesterase [Hypericibacter terrae]|jgi:3',5'-cyclic AMP phosphodiesterase CpdA|uniref:Metallophosphoesterase n=1 Tax=Hypericibacter terrae TaxID=2602015 RepID=A0A5J6MCK4_9PROT|nr:metallophosphoesterase [Hypericibacter terrae]QEX15043.1 metallophosphoesterase [Hypericibacter terrae]